MADRKQYYCVGHKEFATADGVVEFIKKLPEGSTVLGITSSQDAALKPRYTLFYAEY